ncbi:DNA topoisomerase III [Leishmania donovani]|uniref:DNA topoisomerase n=3 Tax=Leishmania donovani species complex TaxID=38574 RepID=A0A6L0XX05_LEIIN|nr:putative DNA topoisomerase III [Leishmania infantum JPCM5]TPP42118.1 DNA topoisomerase family protein [Leishmania donovani]CAC9551031.1 DNA_topoisomerase_III_-_putative [Leishmania infantum]CAJ1993706.1 DNA topoisomerase III [Leishmania donovani]CAM72839.1 putative DNA topoisomerase III [Leishmania infantum JPCM5]SUZ46712.1 DNA_topoisomerase_III_-_putative [Leishmania infantum]|eukprot:XP_001469727.1 putative DNA topoisomerase III [Leishmania infantum JPCM5]
MPTWLNVAEKPSVAKEMAQSLSGGNCRTVPSQSRFNPVYEFKFEGKTMLVTSVAGHLMEDQFPPNTKNWSTYPFQGLFSAPITKYVRADLEPVKKNLEALAGRADTLVLWLDCDREGENICFEVMQVVQSKRPQVQVKRAHFSALTARDLLNAVHNLKLPDKRLSDAVEARQEMDLRIGAAFTRYQTVKFRHLFAAIPGVLSFGPCQFPTLGFVVRRYWQQQGFVPEDFFTLQLQHGDTKFHSSRGSMYDQVAATLIYEDMLQAAAAEGHKGRITNVQQRPSHRRPPVPLATVVMQKLAATHLRIPSERCMTLAESLYQEGLISYPRTETDSYTFQESELLELVRVQIANADVAEYVAAMLADIATRVRPPLRGGHDDKAHPPIHPTKAWNATQDERGRLYNLIVRHFLASLSPDAVAATTQVSAEFGGELFSTGGTTILQRGWLDIFPYERWNNTCIPNYQIGDTFQPTAVPLKKGCTSAPPHLTETHLISLMDSNGIGTDATIAQHIKTVLDREYVKREGQSLVPTTLGIALASAYESLGLASLLQPQLRAQMELAMGDIANGAATKEQVVAAAVQLYEEIFSRLMANTNAFYEELKRYLQPAVETDACAVQATVVKANFIPCGTCGRLMDLVERAGERDREVWSVRCHACNKMYRVPNGRLNTLEPVSPPHTCPLCGFLALRVANREKKTSYHVCPHCFGSPPKAWSVTAYGSAGAAAPLPDVEAAAEFRCFQCTADCPLAKGLEAIGITTCIACRQHELRLRSGANGFFLSCRGYPSCHLRVSLPAAASVKPSPSQRCPACSAVLLTFDFSGRQGVPGLDMLDTICVRCDARIKDYIAVKGMPTGGANSSAVPSSAASVASTASRAYTLPSVKPSARRSVRGGGQRGGSSGDAAAANTSSGGVDPVCGCGAPAKQLVSRKEASRGKRFLTCAHRQCSFFQWLD